MIAKLLVITAVTVTWVASVSAETVRLPEDARFCPSWAEAHERTLASLNHGRPPFPVRWKGCIFLKQGTQVDLVESIEQSTEIVVKGKHWFTDEQLF